MARTSTDFAENKLSIAGLSPLLQKRFALEYLTPSVDYESTDTNVTASTLLSELLSRLTPAKSSIALLSGIPEDCSLSYLAGIMQSRSPTSEDWRRMMLKQKTSRWIGPVLVSGMLSAMSVAAAIVGVWMATRTIPITILIGITVIFPAMFHLGDEGMDIAFLLFSDPRRIVELLRKVFTKDPTEGPLLTRNLFLDHLIGLYLVLGITGWVPMTLWWMSYPLARIAGQATSIVAEIALVGVFVLVIRWKKLYHKSNPLAPLAREFRRMYLSPAKPLATKASASAS